MVSQVQVISILMIVNGALVSLMGLLLTALGPFMFVMLNMDKKGGPPPDERAVLGILSAVYLALGLLVLTAGLLTLIAGIRCLKFRGRVFAIVALFLNVIPVFTFYCAPTSLGVMIYGLIVLFNADVARAFQMAAEGVPPDEIRARFSGYRRRDDWEEDEEDYPDVRR
jgi:drug/metabolite transporter (DMT)-like permease